MPGRLLATSTQLPWLTRLPILGAQQWQLLWPSRHYDGSEPSEPRAALFARLEFGPAPVWVGTTHLPRNDPWSRDKALDRLKALTSGLGDRWLLCGDFNTSPSSWPSDDAPVAGSDHLPQLVRARLPAPPTLSAPAEGRFP
jgi:hypothetical protein